MIIVYDNESSNCLPNQLELDSPLGMDQTGNLYLLDWATVTLQAPHFPTEKVFQAAADEIRKKCKSQTKPEFILKERVGGKWESTPLE